LRQHFAGFINRVRFTQQFFLPITPIVSAAMIRASLCLEETDLALASDIPRTSSSGSNAGSISSAQLLHRPQT